jgi:PadR family transcriptional regulator, regulatory protein PadR
MTAIG